MNVVFALKVLCISSTIHVRVYETVYNGISDEGRIKTTFQKIGNKKDFDQGCNQKPLFLLWMMMDLIYILIASKFTF